MITDDLVKNYPKYKKRIGASLHKHGLLQHAEDATQEFYLGVLEGKHQHQTIDQFVIDYLRRFSGRKGSSGYEQRVRFGQPTPYETLNGEASPCVRAHIDSHRNFWRLLSRLAIKRDRYIGALYYFWGFSEAEIANYYQTCESRVSQILKRIQSRLSARITKESRAPSKRLCEVEAVGTIPREEISLGENKKLAFEKPREVASLDGEGFEEWIA